MVRAGGLPNDTEVLFYAFLVAASGEPAADILAWASSLAPEATRVTELGCTWAPSNSALWTLTSVHGRASQASEGKGTQPLPCTLWSGVGGFPRSRPPRLAASLPPRRRIAAASPPPRRRLAAAVSPPPRRRLAKTPPPPSHRLAASLPPRRRRVAPPITVPT